MELREQALHAPAGQDTATDSLRQQALAILLECDAAAKAARALALPSSGDWSEQQQLREPGGVPGRPARPALVPHTQLKQRSVRSVEGRAALIHALVHIELNAIDLALDVVWRFAGLPAAFYRDWTSVAREEALHFQLLREHLQGLGFDYGDFPAHHGLWEMAERTKHDLLARLALVPRTLEARGLDASPAVKEKLVAAGDLRAGEILDILLRDEIRHVRLGNAWYRQVCAQRGLDPLTTYEELAQRFRAPRQKGPFNLEARRAAGFDEEEIAALAGASEAVRSRS
jgi:uncharacterized ferritin-like protein (DUF455 family)